MAKTRFRGAQLLPIVGNYAIAKRSGKVFRLLVLDGRTSGRTCLLHSHRPTGKLACDILADRDVRLVHMNDSRLVGLDL